MTDDKPRPPVLGDTRRPPVPERMKRWLKTSDAIRAAREAGDDAKAEEIERRYRESA